LTFGESITPRPDTRAPHRRGLEFYYYIISFFYLIFATSLHCAVCGVAGSQYAYNNNVIMILPTICAMYTTAVSPGTNNELANAQDSQI